MSFKSISEALDAGALDDMGEFYEHRAEERQKALLEQEAVVGNNFVKSIGPERLRALQEVKDAEAVGAIVVVVRYDATANVEQLRAAMAEAAFQSRGVVDAEVCPNVTDTLNGEEFIDAIELGRV